jgi:Fe-S cluster assembly ATP-binding protein
MTALLEIKGLHAEIAGGRKIIQGLDLTVNKGEIHAIMGPNGAGKSTLSYVLAGKPGYEITAGEVYLNGEDLLAMEANERAAKGVFLAFQYPLEIPGVATLTRKARGEEELSSPDLIKRVREIAKTLNIDAEMLKRPLNVGFSGGEKKRNETLQMALLQPSLCVLDETDSGLDIDALKVVAHGVNALRSAERGMIVITHYQRLLDYIVPDIVHVFAAGRIVRTGGADLARELEATGYAQYQSEAA